MKKSIKEGSMSDIDVMAKEASSFKEFVKEFYKEFKDFPKNTDAIKWLEGMYKSVSEGTESDGLERVADGLPQTVEETINEISLSSAGVRDFLRALYRDNKIVKKLGFANFKGVVDYIRGSGGRDWDELRDEATAFGLQFESVNEVSTSFVSGNSGRTVTHLDNKKYQLTKDVKGAQIGSYHNVVLPKGSIIHNLPGGVFVNHPSLKGKFSGIKEVPNFGLMIRTIPDTLIAIEKSSKILEYVNEDHSGDPTDKYVVRPCEHPIEKWAVWEGEVRVKGFETKPEAEAFADAKNKEQGITEVEDVIDTITMDVPLFIRTLEFAREDAKTDMDLHDFSQRAIKLTKEKGTIDMSSYNELIGISSVKEGAGCGCGCGCGGSK